MPSRTVRQYPSDLTDAQWEHIRYLLPKAKVGGRPRTTNLRLIVNAVFYLNKSGCSWRYLPSSFSPWKTVHHYFSVWSKDGTWQKIHDSIVKRVRVSVGKNKLPSCAIVDSQSVRAACGENRGYDGFKKVRGRKRQILVDTLGFIHSIDIHAANLADSKQGHKVYVTCSKSKIRNLKIVCVDLGYRGDFVKQTESIFGFTPTLPATNPNSGQGKRKTAREKLENRKLRGAPKKRWVVERTFAWFNNYRRLSRDYERRIINSKSMIYVAMTQLLLQRKTIYAR